MLFSATLNTKVQGLSRIALKSPETILLHQKKDLNDFEIPKQLKQFYVI